MRHHYKALSQAERQKLILRYSQPDVRDLTIRQAFCKLIDQGEYFGSETTVRRVLKKAGNSQQIPHGHNCDFTPKAEPTQEDEARLLKRQAFLEQQRKRHPERWAHNKNIEKD